jgi:protein-L-isoaspartate(D-aspartate) O-methyltransferase
MRLLRERLPALRKGIAAFVALLLAAALAQTPAPSDPYSAPREAMVREQLAARDVTNAGVLAAMRAVPRHLFMPPETRALAYVDRPVPIGHSQTISQPYIVALMTQLLEPAKSHKVLEIGTGSGYQAAVLSVLVRQVVSLEIVPELARSSAETLAKLGYKNVAVHHADGYKGWPAGAPYDRIIVTAAPPELPRALIDQLAPGGKLVAPVGSGWWAQELIVLDKAADGRTRRRAVLSVRFVPMVPGK